MRQMTLALVLVLLVGCEKPTVMRRFDGTLIEGRFIGTEAYTLYAIGAAAEAGGNLPTALAAFEQAAEYDSESPDIWTRIGALQCQMQDASEGWVSLAHALDLDPQYEPAFREQARCALRLGKLEDALKYLDLALVADPGQEEVLLLQAAVLEKAGRAEEAMRTLTALTVQNPRSVQGWEALRALSLRTQQDFRAKEAAERLAKLLPGHKQGANQPLEAPLAEVDRALMRGNLKEARKHARKAALPAAEVAVRAAALGQMQEAKEQAELVWGADPSSASALIALVTAADVLGKQDVVGGVLGSLMSKADKGGPDFMVPPSPLAKMLFAELLYRRVGREGAKAWLGTMAPPSGELEGRLYEQLRKRLGMRDEG